MQEKKIKTTQITDESRFERDKRLWTREEALEFLGIGKSKLSLMMATNEIPFLRIGNQVRFIPEQMWAWAKKKTAS